MTLAVRNVEAGERTAAEIAGTTGNKQVSWPGWTWPTRPPWPRSPAAWDGPLHILVNNAGIMACPLMRTPEGWEMQFATNHLGHFALATGLHDALAAAGGARVVSVSSSGHLRSPVVFDDIHFLQRPYEPWAAYGQSKTANVLFAVGGDQALGRRRHHRQRGDAGRDPDQPAALRQRARTWPGCAARPAGRPAPSWKTPEQGAATSVLVATSPLLDGIGGRYFEDCNEAGLNEPGTRRGVAAYALDPGDAALLWQVSVDTLAS